ncbi:MAG TPA: hypothetical protein PKD71_07935, partial [Ottowia sp.]|nr:hypothetical protein [Ottowia sp.]
RRVKARQLASFSDSCTDPDDNDLDQAIYLRHRPRAGCNRLDFARPHALQFMLWEPLHKRLLAARAYAEVPLPARTSISGDTT